MSNKTTSKSHYTIHPAILTLIFIQCLVTLYVVIHQQTQIAHQALVEKIKVMQATGLKLCIDEMK